MPTSPRPSETAIRPGGPVRESKLYGGDTDPHRDKGPQALERGSTVGRYLVLDRLGAGGMGIVYAAFDPELDRKIALKLLRPGRRRRLEVARARLLREAQALARLSHPSVVAVHDVGTYEGQVFIAMEFVDGRDLAQWCREKKRGWAEVLSTLRLAGEGLAAAHEAGVVHRDFKPENVLVGHDGRVRVLDFGLARTADEEEDAASSGSREASELHGIAINGTDETIEADASTRVPSLPRLTQAGAVVGTPPYMAPEQHRGGESDARSDQFSFCVALYEAFYGERPFSGRTLPELAFNVLHGKLREPPRDGPSLPAWLRRVVERGLSVAPSDRWPDMRALLTALSYDRASKRNRVVIGALAVGAIAAGGIAFWQSERGEAPCQGAERKLAGIWDDSVRSDVRTAFQAIDRPYVADSLRWATGTLDDYARRWTAMHTDACEATAIRKEQSQDLLDRRMACLERRLGDLGALSRRFASADEEIVRASVDATAALPPLTPCADSETLMARTAPLSGEQADRVAEIEEMLAEARQARALQKYDEGLEVVRDALGAARVLGHQGTQAQALFLMGQLQNGAGDLGAAEKTLLDAVWTADEAGEDGLRAEAWGSLIWVAGVEEQRFDDAERYHGHAQHALARAGNAPLLEASVANSFGATARKNAAVEEAIAQHQKALDLRRANLQAEDPEIADSLLNLGLAIADAGRMQEAEEKLAEATEMFERSFGPHHPRMADVLHTRGVFAFRQQDEEAVTLLRRARAIRESAFSPDHLSVALAHNDVGFMLIELGKPEEALKEFERAVEIREATLGREHPKVSNALTGLGQALVDAGRADEARPVLERALDQRRKQDASEKDQAESRFALARAVIDVDRQRAVTLAGQALAVYRRSGIPADRKKADKIDAWLANH